MSNAKLIALTRGGGGGGEDGEAREDRTARKRLRCLESNDCKEKKARQGSLENYGEERCTSL